jgi:phosphorylase superfamily protein
MTPSRSLTVADFEIPERAPPEPGPPPLLARKDHRQPSVFRPENMLREARRQKGITPEQVPAICMLDADGDILRQVRDQHGARRSAGWACYHSELWQWESGGVDHGIIGGVVGAPFAVLIAEELFTSGCEVLISVASAGQISPIARPPYHVLIDRALRDEGTSYHYLPAAEFAEGDPALVALAADAFRRAGCSVQVGASWTTDAPFRETALAIEAHKRAGVLAVEMEAAALYAFGAARGCPVLCLAHVSNQLGCIEGDFEKGEDDGACSSIDLIMAFSSAWQGARRVAQEKLA